MWIIITQKKGKEKGDEGCYLAWRWCFWLPLIKGRTWGWWKHRWLAGLWEKKLVSSEEVEVEVEVDEGRWARTMERELCGSGQRRLVLVVKRGKLFIFAHFPLCFLVLQCLKSTKIYTWMKKGILFLLEINLDPGFTREGRQLLA